MEQTSVVRLVLSEMIGAGANACIDSEAQREFLEKNPKKYLEYRKQIENELNQRFKFIIKGSKEAIAARDYSHDEMRMKLNNDPRLVEKIIPKDFNPGCRRPSTWPLNDSLLSHLYFHHIKRLLISSTSAPAPGYLEALVADNSIIFTDPIASITDTGFIDHEGKPHDVDVIILATGFDTSWLPRFSFIANGKDLKELWGTEKGVTSYLSVGIPTFPNHFSYCGP